MRIIQISDSHLAQDIPQRKSDLTHCIESVNAEQPDLVIHTGDITHNGTAEEYQIASDCLESLNAPYFLLNGNKDVRELIRQTFTEHRYLQQYDRFLQYSIEQDDIRLIVVDTVKEQSSKGELCQQRLQHLQLMLEADISKPVLIFMHHAPFEIDVIPDPRQFHDWTEVEAFEKLITTYDNVAAIYCGHIHRDLAGSIGHVPVHVLNCTAIDLRKGELSEEDRSRPRYRIIDR